MSSEVEKLARRLNMEASDPLLVDLLKDAEIEILNYCNRPKIVKGMEVAIRSLAIVYYNRIGSEGESSRSEGGISRTFETGIPADIKHSLSRYRVGRMRSLK